MKRFVLFLVVLGVASFPALAQKTLYVSPDVPTDDPGGSGTVFMPWHVFSYKAGIYSPALAVILPPNTTIDAVHKMDNPGHWLMSVESTAELPPGGGVFYEPEDVFVYDGANYAMYFDGSANGVPPGVNVDALFLHIDDFGDLILSFDVPTTIGPNTFEPADLVRFTAVGYTVFFDASASGAGIALSGNVTGADWSAGLDVLALDVPTDLLPSAGPVTYVPGDIAAWDGSIPTYLLFDQLANWPLSSEVDAFSCQGNPSRVYDRVVYHFPITLGKSPLVPGDIDINWSPSCSAGAEDYGIYEGTIGSWYSHRRKTCTDPVPAFTERITPQNANSYYLVVPHNLAEEGSYCKDYVIVGVPVETERPQPALAADRCVVTQILTPCP
jgi:hypothetical protein